MLNHLLSGTNKRKAWEEREGYYPPSTVVISLTMKCNLSCYGCYAGDYGKENTKDAVPEIGSYQGKAITAECSRKSAEQ